MRWTLSHRFDAGVVPIADRHYNRHKVGAPQFAPPGRLLVLRRDVPDVAEPSAYWLTSWQYDEHTRHAWPGAWLCTAFRNEGADRSSELIREAVAATRWKWGDPPPLGMVTFVDSRKVRHKRDPGRCYLRAGFRYAPCGCHDGIVITHAGARTCISCFGDGRARTKDVGLHVLQLLPADMPDASPPLGASFALAL